MLTDGLGELTSMQGLQSTVSGGQLVSDLTSRSARLGGDRPAFAWSDGTRSYAAVQERSQRLACLLSSSGVAKGDRVALLSRNRPEIAELLFAASRIGFVVVPLNYRLAPHEIGYQLSDARVTHALWDPDLSELSDASGLKSLQAWKIGDDLDDALEAADMELSSVERPSEHDPVVQIYTSGTTGKPKGCMLSNRNLLATAYNTVWAADLRPRDAYVNWPPMIHRGGMDLMLGSLCAGATVIAANSPDADEIWALTEQHAATGFSWMAGDSRVFTHPTAKRLGHQIERVVHGAGMDSEEMFELMFATLPNVRYAASYGLSEAGIFITRALNDDEVRLPRTIGRPTIGCDVELLGNDGEPVRVGDVGEICVRGPSVMLGYFERPQDTAQAVTRTWLRTGDLASADEDGYLYFQGRLKDMVKSGGENVYCTEIEQVLLKHPGVVEAIVFGVPDARWGEAVKAVIVPESSALPTALELDGWCLERIAAFKRPRWYEFAADEDIPRSTFRKPAKNVLRSQHDPTRCVRAPERTPVSN